MAQNELSLIENGRAKFAYEEVKKFVSKQNVENAKLFKSYIKKMPAMIQVNGLGQTIAFYYSKMKKEKIKKEKTKINKEMVYCEIYKIIEKWFREKFSDVASYQADVELIEAIVKLESPEYRLATNEAMALLNWMKKFVSGMVEGETNDDR